LPSGNCSRPTTVGRKALLAISKKTSSVPTSSVTRMNCQYVRASSSAAAGRTSRRVARPQSHQIITRRRGRRSTQTPAGRPMNSHGRKPAATIDASCSGVACRVIAAA
jgi:hypothetical protein